MRHADGSDPGSKPKGIPRSTAYRWMMQVPQQNDFPTWETGQVLKDLLRSLIATVDA